MGLIINQGVQDTSQDMSYEIIVENDVLVKLTDISLHEKFEKTLSLEFTIIRGKHAQRKVWDNAPFDPASEFSWKYRAYRKAAGCAYTPGEPANIDVEALMLNKPFVLNLGIRKGKDGKEYQQVTLSKTPVTTLTAQQGAPRPGFGGAVPTQPMQAGFNAAPAGWTAPAQPAQPQAWGQPAPVAPQQPQAWGAPAPQAPAQPQAQDQWGTSNDTLDIASDDLPF